jgi:hypothetical protein
MIAFEIFVNGERRGTAGIGDLGVLSAILTWVRRAPQNSRNGKSFEEELTLSVGGYHENTSSDWVNEKLSVADSVTVNVISTDKVDAPKRTRHEDPDRAEKSERRYFEQLKKKYSSEASVEPSNDPKTRPKAKPRRR